MTTGEHNGRAYGYGDPAYPPSRPAYPSIPADPGYGRGPAPAQPDPRYPAPAPDHPGYRQPAPPPTSPPAEWYPPEDRYLPPPDRGRYPNGYPPASAGRATVGQPPPDGGEPPVATQRRGRAPVDRAGSPEPPSETPGKRRRKRLPLWQELPLLLVIAFCLAVLIRTFLLQAFYIPSGSMEDTLLTGDRVLVDKVVYNFRDPVRGEVVVFRGTDAWAPAPTGDDDLGTISRIGQTFGDLIGISRPGDKDFIKRVIGVPGDVISCCSPADGSDGGGHIYVNGVPIEEPYVIRDSPLGDTPDGTGDCRFRQFADVVVEPGHIFVMGDHRQRSQDSRCQGQVPIENVIGRARFVVWPQDRWTTLPATDAFDDVPEPAATGALPAATGAEPATPAGAVGAQAGLLLPVLLPLAARSPRGWACRLRTRPARSRRLAE